MAVRTGMWCVDRSAKPHSLTLRDTGRQGNGVGRTAGIAVEFGVLLQTNQIGWRFS